MYASSANVCERKPQRNPASDPSSSSATNDVSRKWTKKSFGSIAAIGLPPHQSSIDGVHARVVRRLGRPDQHAITVESRIG